MKHKWRRHFLKDPRNSSYSKLVKKCEHCKIIKRTAMSVGSPHQSYPRLEYVDINGMIISVGKAPSCPPTRDELTYGV